MSRLIVLTGAPAPSALHWDEYALSGQGIKAGGGVDRTKSLESSHTFSAQWRRVRTEEALVHTDQQTLNFMPSPYPVKAIFLTTADLTAQTQLQDTSVLTSTNVSTASMLTAAEILDDFYTQSLAVHEDLTASRLSDFQNQTTSLSDSECGEEKPHLAPSKADNYIQSSRPFPAPCPHLSDLKDIPSATYLQSIGPRAATVDLIVGIMTLGPPRQVTVGRRWGREQEMQLVEMLVGDETRAGFEITMWLSSGSKTTGGLLQRGGLELQIQRVRPRDVVLLRNVALRAYQGRVHGQSLRRDATKVDLLYRRRLDGSDTDVIYNSRTLLESVGTDPVREKVKRVSRWLMDYVGDGDICDNDGEVSRRPLPPDTQ